MSDEKRDGSRDSFVLIVKAKRDDELEAELARHEGMVINDDCCSDVRFIRNANTEFNSLSK